MSLAVLIRTLRPNVCLFGGIGWLLFRIVRVMTRPEWAHDPTILDSLLDGIKRCRTLVWDQIREHSNQNSGVADVLLLAVDFGFQILHDIFGVFVLLGTLRMYYCLSNYTWAEIRIMMEDAVFEWAKKHIPAVSRELDKETEKMIPDAEKSWGRESFRTNKILALPSQGRNPWEVFKEIADHATKEHTNTWKQGKTSGTVYTADETHIQFMNEVYGLYSVANVLHPGVWPKLTNCETELIAMTSHMLHGTGVGCTTSGGTESIMLAIKAHLVYFGKQRGIFHPELICGTTAHAAVDKACEVFGIRKICINCDNMAANYTLCPKQVERRITANTIMIYGSAPNYPQGTIDPIDELGEIAQRYDIGLHVDACLGGFVLPFATPGTFPTFDFQVPGVTSMSADTHKFGYAPKGTSIVLYRTKELRHAQYFSYAKWTGGIYATPTFAGSRPSALIGCAWASLVTIGLEGFQQRTQKLLAASRIIADGIRNEIPELIFMGGQEPTMVVCFGSETLSVYRVADIMKTKGWTLSSLQSPASVHICITLPIAPHAKLFVSDLKDAVVEVSSEASGSKDQGTAGIYGMAGSIPKGPVNDLLKAFLDVGLTA